MDPQYAAAYPDLYNRHWWWRVREEILLRKIGRLLSDVPDARILDVGCGGGLFFEALRSFGHVEGIESDRVAVERSPWSSRITVGELDDSYKPSEPFELILMLDVLEHVPDPARMLRRGAAILAPGGSILVTVPAFSWLWTSHDEVNHHLRRYTRIELRNALQAAGVDVTETSYLFQSLVVPKLLIRALEAMTSPSPSVPSVPNPAINVAMQSWYRAEHALAGWLPFGGSLLAIGSRRPNP